MEIDLKNVDLDSQFTASDVADHQVLVSWNSDLQAEAFEEWLFDEGFLAFKQWAQDKDFNYV